MLLATTLFASGCVTSGSSPIDTFCATERQRILTEHDARTLPLNELRAILERNEYGAKQCGWQGTKAKTNYWGSIAGIVGRS